MDVNADAIKVLLVEDNRDYARMLKLILSRDPTARFQVSDVRRLSSAIKRLEQEPFDVVVLDLSLPDSGGYDTFKEIYPFAVEIPIVVLTAINDKNLAIRAVREGAQDYLIKGDVEGVGLGRALAYAIERQRTLSGIQRQSYIDDLTGLLNRRGFFFLALKQMKIAKRANRSFLLFFADMDGLKKINDNFGHLEGDQALKTVASALRATFRSSDLLARLGGDEFTVLAVDAQGEEQIFVERFQQNLQAMNALNERYQISVSIGAARYDPSSDISLESMLAQSDIKLYANKHIHNNYSHPQ